MGVLVGERGRAIDNANGATPWTPQIAAVAHPFEEGFHRRAAALGTRHGNQLGTVHQDAPWIPPSLLGEKSRHGSGTVRFGGPGKDARSNLSMNQC
jgi:hypothetical protein